MNIFYYQYLVPCFFFFFHKLVNHRGVLLIILMGWESRRIFFMQSRCCPILFMNILAVLVGPICTALQPPSQEQDSLLELALTIFCIIQSRRSAFTEWIGAKATFIITFALHTTEYEGDTYYEYTCYPSSKRNVSSFSTKYFTNAWIVLC